MARFGKKLRKGTRRLVRHRFIQEVLEDLVAATLIAAAAKIGEGIAAAQEDKPAKAKRKSRKSPGPL